MAAAELGGKWDIGAVGAALSTGDLSSQYIGLAVIHNEKFICCVKKVLQDLITVANNLSCRSLAMPFHIANYKVPIEFARDLADAVEDYLSNTVLQSIQSAVKLSTKTAGVTEIYVCAEDIQSLDTLKAILQKRFATSAVKMYDFSCLLPCRNVGDYGGKDY